MRRRTLYPSKLFKIVLELGGMSRKRVPIVSVLSAANCERDELDVMLKLTTSVHVDKEQQSLYLL